MPNKSTRNHASKLSAQNLFLSFRTSEARSGIQNRAHLLDSRFRGNDRNRTKTLHRLTASALVFLFIFTLLPRAAFAQEAAPAQTSVPAAASTPAGDEAVNQPADTGTPDNSVSLPDSKINDPATEAQVNPEDQTVDDSKKDEPVKEEKPAPEDQSQLNSLGQQGQATTLASQPSTIKQQLPEADAATGALTYSYPIVVPPGRNGLQPDLALQYNSQNLEAGSAIGQGWSVNIPHIERLSKKGTDKLYTENYFISSLDGELVDLGSGNFGAKKENGSFLKYAFTSNQWTVTDKSGTVYKFGTAAASRQDNPADSTKVFRWMLDEVRDTNNNYIKYEYYKDAGQIYPSLITYTGNGTTDGIFQVEFLRESRSDVVVSNITGFTVTTNYRINQIKTKISGVMARTYTLAFEVGINGHRSLLGSITESGRDDSGNIIALPAVEFDYTNPSGVGWTANTTFNIPTDVRFVSGSGYVGSAVVDVNGDGLNDVLQDTAVDGKWVHINHGDGTGWEDTSSWTLPADFNLRNGWGIVADINGDNLPDLMSEVNGQSKFVFLNNGTNGWTDVTASWNVPEWIHFNSHSYQVTMLVDINGDGFADILREEVILNSAVRKVFINKGDNTGWEESTTWAMPEYPFGLRSSGLQGSLIGDVNGDNLPDLMFEDVSANPVIKNLYINNGKDGWVLNTALAIPTEVRFVTSGSQAVALVDINGDSWNDFIQQTPTDKYIFINDGDNTGWTQNTSWTLPTNFDMASSGTKGSAVADVDGDGMVDLMSETSGQPKYLFINNGDKSDLLSKITYPEKGFSDVVYKQSPLYLNGSTVLNPNMPVVLDTVYQVTNNNGLGNTTTATYQYEGGRYYYGGPTERELAGFNKVTKTDSAGNKVVSYFHQGNTTDSSNGEYSDHVSKIGKPYRVDITNASANKYAATINKWDKYDLGSGRNFVKMVQTIGQTYDGNASHKDAAVAYSYNDTTGNLTQKVDWGEVTGTDSGTFTDVGSDKFTTDYTYATQAGTSKSQVSSELTTNQSAVKVRETKNYFDTLAFGSLDKGNLTKQESWKTGSTYIDVEKTYNATYGIVTQEKDPRDKATNYVYDSFNLYPATATNALSQQTQYVYDYSLGKPKQVTDPNTRVFQTVYDGLDSVIEEKQPDLTTPSTLVTKATYAYTPQTVGNQVKQSTYLDATNIVDSYTYTDGFDRPIQTRTEMEDANTFAVSDTTYNNIGQVNKQSLPYSSTGSSKTTATTDNNLLSTFSYDPMYRVTSVANIIGTVSTAFDDWKSTVTDARGKVKNLFKDAYNNLVKVEEINSGSTYTTLYEYDGNSNLTKITDALSNIRNFTYDGLGRRLTAQDLHASADATFGTWTYTYDDAGNLTSTLDPKSQTVNYAYDDINRVSTEDFTGQAGTEVAYTYDSCTNGAGRLCSVFKLDNPQPVIINYLYNPLGVANREVKTIDAVNYQTDYTHDRQGNVLTIANPDASQVKYTYNAGGQLETVQRKESTDGSFINVTTDFDYGPHGKLTYQANANGTATTNTYDAAKLYRLSRKQTYSPTGSTSTTMTFYPSAGDGYVYNDNANWDTAHDATSGTTVSYTASTFYVGNGMASSTIYRLRRAFIPFDTATLPDGATITSAKLKVYVASKQNSDNDGDDWVTAVQTTQSGTTTLSTGDFDLAGAINSPTEGIDSSERKDITSIATGAYLEFNLNTTGRSWVNKTGYTKLGLREGHDAIDSPFVGSTGNNYIILNGSETSGTTTDPILEVTYDAAGSYIQDNTYTYDANGNITKIVDASSTSTSKTVDYTYDDLNRLLSATGTGVAAGQSTYTESYTYSAIGNILTKTVGGTPTTYSYQGDQGASYANPHAATSIGAATLAYDNNGNLTGDGTLTNTWDYGNRLTQSQKSGITDTYTYDHTGSRVKLSNGTVTTYYPSDAYNTDSTGKKTKHLFAGDAMSLTVEGTGAGATIYYQHTDHLSGQGVTTNTSGTAVETLDYFPYGTIRIDEKAGAFAEQRKYAGHEFDADTALSYMEARYYNAATGRFISQDTAFWSLPAVYFLDPQQQNSYSYARNNPMAYVDPTGNSAEAALSLVGSGVTFLGGVVSAAASLGLGAAIAVGVWPRPITDDFNELSQQEKAGLMGPPTPMNVNGPPMPTINPHPIAAPQTPTITATPISPTAPNTTVTIDGFNWWVGQNPITMSTRAPGAINQEKYLGQAQDDFLRRTIGMDYREKSTQGDGGTADAIREELRTGQPLKNGRWHSQKGQELINRYNKTLRNPNASEADKGLAKNLRNNLKNSLKGK